MRVFVLFSLLLALGACAPTVRELPPSSQPFVFETNYDTLFEATLQTVASTRISYLFTRASFVIANADRETGLITAVRLGRNRFSGVGTVGIRRSGFGLGFRSGLVRSGYSTLGGVQADQSLISIVVQPAGEGAASLAYSSTATDVSDLNTANAFMAEVVQRLLVRFGTAAGQ